MTFCGVLIVERAGLRSDVDVLVLVEERVGLDGVGHVGAVDRMEGDGAESDVVCAAVPSGA
ncbi:hypothetical protein OHT68_47915 [Streptomyces canus]|nr:hypothetical protein [Streptomyces canus]